MSGQQNPPVPETSPEPNPDANRNVTARLPVPPVQQQPMPQQHGAPGWGAPPAAGSAPGQAAPKATAWTRNRWLMVVGAAVVLAAGTGAGAYAWGSSSAGARTAASAAAKGNYRGAQAGTGAQRQGGAGLAGGGAGGMAAALHSEYVIQQNGQYVTDVEQLGTVSAVSADSITVKSSDGFAQTYVLGANVKVSQQRRQAGTTSGSQLTVADIASGASVRIVASKDSSQLTADTVQLVAGTSTGQSN